MKGGELGHQEEDGGAGHQQEGIETPGGRGMEHQEGGGEGNRAPRRCCRISASHADWNSGLHQASVLTLGVIWHTRRREAGFQEVGELGDPVKGDGAGHQQEGVG